MAAKRSGGEREEMSATIKVPPASSYRELVPPAALAKLLVCTWTQAIGAGSGPYRQRVLPDGCIDIVWIGTGAPVIVGPATRTAVALLPAGGRVLGARFRPGAAPTLLGFPADLATDREINLADAWGRTATEQLSAIVLAQQTPERQLTTLGQALAARAAAAPPADPLVEAAVAWLGREPAGSVRDLGRACDISPRQLRRRFAARVGYGPKTFQRILRLQRVLAMASGRRARPLSLAMLAAAAGYADQAHMTREFSSLAGRTPRRLLADAHSTLALAELFKTDEVALA